MLFWGSRTPYLKSCSHLFDEKILKLSTLNCGHDVFTKNLHPIYPILLLSICWSNTQPKFLQVDINQEGQGIAAVVIYSVASLLEEVVPSFSTTSGLSFFFEPSKACTYLTREAQSSFVKFLFPLWSNNYRGCIHGSKLFPTSSRGHLRWSGNTLWISFFILFTILKKHSSILSNYPYLLLLHHDLQ